PLRGGPAVTTGVVLGRSGGVLRVYTAGREVTASLRGKVKFQDDDRIVAGDVVDLELHAGGDATISGLRPRRSVLARRAAGGGAIRRRYASAGYQVLDTSVKAPAGLPALRDLLRGRESVITGASGVGKSSLLNALEPALGLRTGEISARWRTGRHTTTAAVRV